MMKNEWGKALQSERTKNGISRHEMARRLGVTRQSVICWEKGICRPRKETVSLIIEMFPELSAVWENPAGEIEDSAMCRQASLLLTVEQLRFCDRQGEKQGIARSAYIRSLIDNAMEQENKDE